MTSIACKAGESEARRTLVAGLATLLVVAILSGCDSTSGPGTPPGSDPNPPPGSVQLLRAPYLQLLGERSVIVAFRTTEAASAVVEYGPTPGLGQSVASPVGTQHAVEIDGLAPGQRYYYKVRAGTTTLAGDATHFFETDAGRADSEFSFFVTGDIGQPGGEQATTGSRILATQPRAEIGLICGDVIYPDGESSGYDENLMQPWAGLLRNVAVWPALGNHDWHVDPDLNFRAEWYLPGNEHYYSFDRGNTHFIALDTRDGDIYDAANQVAWLRADLEAHRDATWTIAYYHHPGYTCTYKDYNDAVIATLHPVLDEFAVDVVFMGHAHTYERLYPIRNGQVVAREQEPNYQDPAGTVYVVTGAGAKTNSSTTPDCDINALAIDRTILFTHVTVRGRTLELRTIESATGTVRDRMTITKTQ